jgi:hypothetical protein
MSKEIEEREYHNAMRLLDNAEVYLTRAVTEAEKALKEAKANLQCWKADRKNTRGLR